MNGWEFMEMKRQTDAIAQIPVIVLSATPDKNRPAGAKTYIKKPADLEALLKAVEVCCDGQADQVAS
jgi:CheY-like chemotaxis protein